MAGDWVVGLLGGGALLFIMIFAIVSIPQWRAPQRADVEKMDVQKTAAPIAMGLLGARVDQLDEQDQTRRAGMSGYLLHFEIVSVHLLVVLIGAAYLARAKRRPALAPALE
jgi:NADH-quinone oxidoreductase subunit J